jgi:hypothetical protein
MTRQEQRNELATLGFAWLGCRVGQMISQFDMELRFGGKALLDRYCAIEATAINHGSLRGHWLGLKGPIHHLACVWGFLAPMASLWTEKNDTFCHSHGWNFTSCMSCTIGRNAVNYMPS